MQNMLTSFIKLFHCVILVETILFYGWYLDPSGKSWRRAQVLIGMQIGVQINGTYIKFVYPAAFLFAQVYFW